MTASSLALPRGQDPPRTIPWGGCRHGTRRHGRMYICLHLFYIDLGSFLFRSGLSLPMDAGKVPPGPLRRSRHLCFASVEDDPLGRHSASQDSRGCLSCCGHAGFARAQGSRCKSLQFSIFSTGSRDGAFSYIADGSVLSGLVSPGHLEAVLHVLLSHA